MKVAYKIFPEGLLTGTPSDTVSETPRSKRKPEMADRDKFTADDLAKIDIYLNNALCDKSSGSKCKLFFLRKILWFIVVNTILI
jgi:hypothetical protein